MNGLQLIHWIFMHCKFIITTLIVETTSATVQPFSRECEHLFFFGLSKTGRSFQPGMHFWPGVWNVIKIWQHITELLRFFKFQDGVGRHLEYEKVLPVSLFLICTWQTEPVHQISSKSDNICQNDIFLPNGQWDISVPWKKCTIAKRLCRLAENWVQYVHG